MTNIISTENILEVTVEKIVAEGLALARVDRNVIFLDGGYPGEEVRVRITKRKRNYLEGTVIDVIGNRHAGRIDSPCPHYGVCGGCRFIDIDYRSRLSFKEEILKEALVKIGKINLDDVIFNPIVASPKIFRHRNKMEFAFGANESGELILGLRRPGNFRDVIETTDCLLLPEDSNDFMVKLTEDLRNTELKPFNSYTNLGDLKYLTLRFNEKYEFIAYITVADENSGDTVTAVLDSLKKDFDRLVGYGYFVNSSSGSRAQGDSVTLYGDGYLRQHARGITFDVSPESFFQTNIYCNPLLMAEVEHHTGSGDLLWDLFSGTGTLSLPLAHLFSNVYGIEINEAAVKNAEMNAFKNNISNVNYLANTLKKGLKDIVELGRPDVLIFDPPRCGVGAKLLKKIMDIAPQKIVYVSCNPTTMASDINILSEEYRLVEVTPVDMFPHTYHLETVTHLIKK